VSVKECDGREVYRQEKFLSLDTETWHILYGHNICGKRASKQHLDALCEFIVCCSTLNLNFLCEKC